MEFLKLTNIIRVLLLLLLFPASSRAQIEKVIVETYYVSDESDATDTTGGVLEVGSKTYRVYIDLLPGFKLKKIYGDVNHPMKFSSTHNFFNNKEDGQTFAKDISKNRYADNTVALDSWITLGQVTKASANTHFGIPKKDDTDGSFIGGPNNDGGSSQVPSGLLINNDASAGIPITIADGMDTMLTLPTNWAHYGFMDVISNMDSTIFGSLKTDSQFISYNAALQNSGVAGVIPDSNQILVAQLTTKGEISFELNIEVTDSTGTVYKFVANGDSLATGELVNPNLKYPPSCGCSNPDFLEYNQNFACGIMDSCRTPIVFGCTDSIACNYNSVANFSIPELCCYPGACEGLDVNILCPQLGVEEAEMPFEFKMYPNPVESELNLAMSLPSGIEANYTIYDLLGNAYMERSITNFPSSTLSISISELPSGIYIFHLASGPSTAKKLFLKK